MQKIILAIVAILFSNIAKADDTATINAVYSTVAKHNIEKINIENMAISGLKGLSSVDKDFTFSNGSDSVYLYYKRKMIGLWKKPKKDQDITEWAKITNQVIEAAIKKSSAANKKDFMIVDVVLKNAITGLNDNSKYYSELEEEVKDNKKVKHFAERMFGNILYLKIGSFNQYTAKNISQAIDENSSAKGLILDLRGNSGGQLNAAIDVAKLFIDGGIIASVKGKDANMAKYYNSDSQQAINLPLAIIIDANTASSAEVLAAALQEQVQAKLVGTLSFGKGSIQDTFRFENGGKLALTTAYFYTPADKKIDNIGLVPQYCTYKTVNKSRLNNISEYAKLSCGKESREGLESDIELAVAILQK